MRRMKKRGLLALVSGLVLLAIAQRVAASDRCFLLPLDIGPEQVCGSGAFPSGPFHVGPGDAVSLPAVEYTNNTERVMEFTVEARGSITGSASLISTIPHFATLAPGESATFEHVVILKTKDLVPIGATETIFVGFSAFDPGGDGDYVINYSTPVQLVVGPDSDGDGLVDSWEENGYDPDADGVVDLDLPRMGASPMHKDLFLEIDWQPGAEPTLQAIQEVKQAFALAPTSAGGVANPDGLPGIDLWIDVGDPANGGLAVGDALAGYTAGEQIPADVKICSRFDLESLKSLFFDQKRQHVFRYAVFPRSCCTVGDTDKIGQHCQRDSDCAAQNPPSNACNSRPSAETEINAIFNPLNQWRMSGEPVRFPNAAELESAALMHEFGHLLYLAHGGDPREEFSYTNPEAHGPYEKSVPNCEPNYISIMNYNTRRLEIRNSPQTIIDYSPPRLSSGGRSAAPLADLLEDALDESVALDPNDHDHYAIYSGPLVCINGTDHGSVCSKPEECESQVCGREEKKAAVDGPINWNGDGNIGGIVRANVDSKRYIQPSGLTWFASARACENELGGGYAGQQDSGWIPLSEPAVFSSSPPRCGAGMDVGNVCTTNEDCAPFNPSDPEKGSCLGPLTGHDDWSNIRMILFHSGNVAGYAPALEIEELSGIEVAARLVWSNTADLSVAATGDGDPLEAGESGVIHYVLELANGGPNSGRAPLVTTTLPDGFTPIALDSRCDEEVSGAISCRTPGLEPGEEDAIRFEAAGTPRCQGGTPGVVTTSAMVENVAQFAGEDPDPADNHASLEFEVVDTTPPALSVTVQPESLWPPNHKLVTIGITAIVSDNCDDAPTVRLVSIESNEPDDGLGDGAANPDVQDAQFGSEDFQFLLRAERSGGGNGRVYTIIYEAEDGSGNVARAETTVTVPH
jgi:hypothetical protein